MLTNVFKKSFLYDIIRKVRIEKEYRNWLSKEKSGNPPHKVKQNTVRKYASKYKITTLVETGTYYGDMLDAVINDFSKLYSIELSKDLFTRATKRFKKHESIAIFQGDSKETLKEIFPLLKKEKCLFWLDAHYSEGITAKGEKETPIIEELQIILDRENKNDVILIDDARCFTGKNDYPTIEKLNKFLSKYSPDFQLEIKYDIIRITH